MHILKTPTDNAIIVISSDTDTAIFYEVANILSVELHVSFLNNDRGSETMQWDFSCDEQKFTLQFSASYGTSFFPHHSQIPFLKNDKTKKIRAFLEERFSK
jgi:hypothetical protein